MMPNAQIYDPRQISYDPTVVHETLSGNISWLTTEQSKTNERLLFLSNTNIY
jgi:hypothetical protein